jgi:hypothetical protein
MPPPLPENGGGGGSARGGGKDGINVVIVGVPLSVLREVLQISVAPAMSEARLACYSRFTCDSKSPNSNHMTNCWLIV